MAPKNATKSKKNIRLAPIQETTSRSRKGSRSSGQQRSGLQVRSANMPVATGTQISSVPPVQRKIKDGILITGSDFFAQINVAGTSGTWDPVSVMPIHPAFFNLATIGNMCRIYAKYRFRRVVFRYIPAVSTATAGTLVFTTTRNVSDPALNGTTANSFLTAALATGRATMTPLYMPTALPMPFDGGFRLTDPFTATDIDDQIIGEFIAYSSAAAAVLAGYVTIDYDIEFIEPSYTLHATQLPVPAGNVGYAVLQDSVNKVAAAALLVVSSSGAFPQASFPNGSIFKFVCDVGNATLSGGTLASQLNEVEVSGATTTTTATNTQTLTLSNGIIFWLNLVSSTVAVAYVSYDHAVAGSDNGLYAYQAGIDAGKNLYPGWLYPVRNGQKSISRQT